MTEAQRAQHWRDEMEDIVAHAIFFGSHEPALGLACFLWWIGAVFDAEIRCEHPGYTVTVSLGET